MKRLLIYCILLPFIFPGWAWAGGSTQTSSAHNSTVYFTPESDGNGTVPQDNTPVSFFIYVSTNATATNGTIQSYAKSYNDNWSKLADSTWDFTDCPLMYSTETFPNGCNGLKFIPAGLDASIVYTVDIEW